MDWSYAAEQILAASLSSVPGVGALLGALVYIFWPSTGENVWDEIKAQVEALISQAMSQEVYQTVQDSLQGLNSNIASYLTAVSAGDPEFISQTWVAVEADFVQQCPSFQQEGYEVLLLPLFAAFANLHLSLLRDGVQYGLSWGWNSATQESILQTLKSSIVSYQGWASTTYGLGLTDRAAVTPVNAHLVEPFRSMNTYQRQMTLTVLDFSNLWTYFDPTKYVPPVSVYLDREIYSDPNGTADNSGLVPPMNPPSKPINQITVWGADWVNGVQVQYEPRGGPLGVTSTARLGEQNGGINYAPTGGVFQITSSNPVTNAVVWSGDIVNAMQFVWQDGTWTHKLGGGGGGGEYFNYSYPGEIVSSIWINGVSDFYQCADVVIFGFKYLQSSGIGHDALKAFYIGSPNKISLDDLKDLGGQNAAAASDLQLKVSSEDWDGQRRSYQNILAANRHSA